MSKVLVVGMALLLLTGVTVFAGGPVAVGKAIATSYWYSLVSTDDYGRVLN